MDKCHTLKEKITGQLPMKKHLHLFSSFQPILDNIKK